MKIQLIRHASLWLEYGGQTYLVDPMFGAKESQPPVPNTANEHRNPLVGLPAPADSWAQPDAVLVTHLHPDHWDAPAAELLSRELPVFSQIEDEGVFAGVGFTHVTPVAEQAAFGSTTITRTGGQHGTGEIGRQMGPVSGFVLEADDEPSVYIAGDTIWCEEVKAALDRHRPRFTVVNAGGARFRVGDAITMDGEMVAELCRYAPYTTVIAVHMDAINHCFVTRELLREYLRAEGLEDRVIIPEDGDWV